MNASLKMAVLLASTIALAGCDENYSITVTTAQDDQPDAPISAQAPDLSNGYYMSVMSSYDGRGTTTSWEPIRHDVENQQFISGFESNNADASSSTRFSPAPDYMQYRKYNDKGNMISWEIVSRGVRTMYREYLYNADERLASSTATTDSYTVNEMFSYNDLGQLAQKDIVLSPEGTSLTMTFQYDSAGNRISKTAYQSTSTGQPDITYFYYDSENRLIESQTDKNSDNTIDSRRVHHYDETGNRIEIVAYNELNEMVQTYTFKLEIWLFFGLLEISL